MATAAQNLQTAYDNMAERLAEITANPKPTYSENGRSISWTEYQRFLIDAMAALKTQITAATGPYLVTSYGRV